MRYNSKVWILMVMASVLINSCKEDDAKTRQYNLSGIVQKGPYIIGTSISISELTISMDQTGRIFTTEKNDNTGSFEITDIFLVACAGACFNQHSVWRYGDGSSIFII